MNEITCSAPGKVLLCGGYLVLQSGARGQVVSSSSRFFSTLTHSLGGCVPAAAARSPRGSAASATALAAAASAAAACGGGAVALVIASPQFHDAWGYSLRLGAPTFALVPAADGRDNPYARLALEVAFAAAAAGAGARAVAARLSAAAGDGGAVFVVLRAHNDFYSQRAHLLARGLPLTSAGLTALPQSLPAPVDDAPGAPVRISKTGLGSSAALVTSLVAAALAFVGAAEVGYGGENAAGSGEVGAGRVDSAAAPAGREEAAIGARSAPPFVGQQALALVHVVAQVAHGLAQGKVGSGFDVCSACYGSCAFSRIAEASLGHAMGEAEKALGCCHVRRSGAGRGGCGSIGADAPCLAYARWGARLLAVAGLEGVAPAGTGAARDEPLPAPWAFSAEPFHLPRGVTLMLADVAGGSETPGMVRKVLAWRNAAVGGDAAATAAADATPVAAAALSSVGGSASTGPMSDAAEAEAAAAAAADRAEGPPLWKDLAGANARVAATLAQLQRLASATPPVQYAEELAEAARTTPAEWAAAAAQGGAGVVVSKLAALSRAFARARALLAAMGSAAGVPIEPPTQTALADATLRVPGVVAAGVPGAGGFDALFAVVLDPESVSVSVGCSGNGGGCSSGHAGDSTAATSAVRCAVEGLWAAWPGGGLTPLQLRAGAARGEAGAGVLREA